MDPEYARTILVRLAASGPLLFVGVVMVLAPASFIVSLRALARAVAGVLENFEQSLKVFRPQEQVGETISGYVSPPVRFAIRSFWHDPGRGCCPGVCGCGEVKQTTRTGANLRSNSTRDFNCYRSCPSQSTVMSPRRRYGIHQQIPRAT